MGNVWRKCVAVMMTVALVAAMTLSVSEISEAAVSPKKIILSRTSATLTVGGKLTLKVKSVTPRKASKKVKWKSSNRKVATVTSKGVVRAKKAGTVTITAKSASGKTVIPFCTSGGSGISTASSDLKALCKGKPTWKTGRRFEGDVSQTTINNWVKSVEK